MDQCNYVCVGIYIYRYIYILFIHLLIDLCIYLWAWYTYIYIYACTCKNTYKRTCLIIYGSMDGRMDGWMRRNPFFLCKRSFRKIEKEREREREICRTSWWTPSSGATLRKKGLGAVCCSHGQKISNTCYE